MKPLLDKVTTPQGDVMIITKVRFLFVFRQPRSSVMPMGFTEFGRKLGFQARYNTSDPKTLQELHNFFVERVISGGFDALCRNAKVGQIDLPPEDEHLRQYVLGFHA